MSKIRVIPINIEFENKSEETILHTALAYNINLPHGCKNGDCGSCKAKIISGQVTLDSNYSSSALSDEEKQQGYTLLCKAHAQNDVVVDIPHLNSLFPVKILPARIDAIEIFGQTALVKLKLPLNQKFQYFAGQYIDIILNGKNRSYSIANAPAEQSALEIHVKYHKGGIFSEFIWNKKILIFITSKGSKTELSFIKSSILFLQVAKLCFSLHAI